MITTYTSSLLAFANNQINKRKGSTWNDGRKIVIFGAGDIARLAHFYFTYDSTYEVVAFTVDQAFITSDSFQGLPLVPFESLEVEFPPAEDGLPEIEVTLTRIAFDHSCTPPQQVIGKRNACILG